MTYSKEDILLGICPERVEEDLVRATEIQIRYLPNTSIDRYRYTNMLCVSLEKVFVLISIIVIFRSTSSDCILP